MLGQLDRGLQDFGARVGEEKCVQRGRQHLLQGLGQLDQRLVIDDVYLAVQEFGGLVLDGLDHARVRMAGAGDADAAGEVQQAPAIGGKDVWPFTALDEQRARHGAAPNGRDVREVGRRHGYVVIGKW